MYGEFADVFDLSESKLAIIHCAGHYDPTLVESMWKDIIEKGEKLEATDKSCRIRVVIINMLSIRILCRKCFHPNGK